VKSDQKRKREREALLRAQEERKRLVIVFFVLFMNLYYLENQKIKRQKDIGERINEIAEREKLMRDEAKRYIKNIEDN
jgi:hypothetical protein